MRDSKNSINTGAIYRENDTDFEYECDFSLNLPSFFVTEIMPFLSAESLKLYLNLLSRQQKKERQLLQSLSSDFIDKRSLSSLFYDISIDFISLAELNELDVSEAKVLVDELLSKKLLIMDTMGREVFHMACRFKLPSFTELKSFYLKNESEPGFVSSDNLSVVRNKDEKNVLAEKHDLNNSLNNKEKNKQIAYAKLLKSIEATFSLRLSLTWQKLLADMAYEMNFDHDLIYAIFAKAYNNSKLNASYIRQIAQNCRNKGIYCLKAYEEDCERYDSNKILVAKVKQNLNFNNLTKAQENIIINWKEVYQFSEDLIICLLQEGVNKSAPGLVYFNKIAKNWFDKGIKTVQDLQRYKLKMLENTDKKKNQKLNSKNMVYSGNSNRVYNMLTAYPQRSIKKELDKIDEHMKVEKLWSSTEAEETASVQSLTKLDINKEQIITELEEMLDLNLRDENSGINKV